MKSKEKLKAFHLICITTLFNTSSILVFKGFTESGKLNWITPILGAVLAILASFILFTVSKSFPGKSIYEVINILFPKWASLALNSIYALYSVYLLGRILKNTGILITTVALNKTPQILLEIAIIIICGYALWNGVSVFGRLSILSCVITFFAVSITFIMSFTNIDSENLLPMVPNGGVESVLSDTFSFFIIPFSENILLYNIYASSENLKKNYKPFLIGFSISTLVITAVSFLTLGVLGLKTIDGLFYPFYTTVSVIKNGNFFSRMEVFISASLILNLLTKLGVCFYAALGFFETRNIFKNRLWEFISVGGAATLVAVVLPSTTAGIKDNIESYKIWAPFVQILLPSIIFITLLIKNKFFRKIKNYY